jgi:hypothetical protein
MLAMAGSTLTCGEQARTSSAVVSDSAGVRIVRYEEPLFELGTERSIDSIPIVTIGIGEGDADYELDEVVTAVRLDNGTIVIADRGRNQLLAYDGNGEFLRALGGPGEGPGEFGSIGWLQLVGADTLLVYDQEIRRVTAFTLDGGFAWSTQLPGAGFAWPGDFRSTDGTYVLAVAGNDVWDRIRAGTVLPGATARNRTYLTTFGANDRQIDTIGSFAGYEEAVVDREGRVATVYAPWGRNTAFALMPDGRIVVGTQENGELAIMDRRGKVEEVVRWTVADLVITDQHIEQFHDVMFQRIDDPAERQAAIDQLGDLPLPATRAAHGELMTDVHGLIWVSEAHLPLTPAREWSVIDLESGNLARVIMPSGFDLLWIGEDEVLGRTTDEMGVHRVEVRALRRSLAR